MDDLIRRLDAIDAFWKLKVEIRPSAIYAIDEMFRQLPSADARKNRKGNWRISYIPSKDEIEMEYCSECGWGKMIEEKREYNFCPNCGAMMSDSLKWHEVGKSLVDGIQDGIKGGKDK